MTEPYTPTELEISEAWVSQYARDGWLTKSAIAQAHEEVRRFLAGVEAKAWDEGFEAGAEAAGRWLKNSGRWPEGCGPDSGDVKSYRARFASGGEGA